MSFQDLYGSWLENGYPLLEGRLLLWNEVKALMQNYGCTSGCGVDYLTEQQLKRLLRMAYHDGHVEIKSAVNLDRKRLVGYCERCGSNEQIIIQACASCGSDGAASVCATCEACINMGRSTSCTPLFYFRELELRDSQDMLDSQESHDSPTLMPPVTYSPRQQAVAQQVEAFMHNCDQRQFLLWAVTGAGKTELCYPAISYALERGQRVLFTAPRKDVIRELAIRFKRDFPSVRISALYGDSPDKEQAARFYLATSQQTIRFYQYFDLVIIDELDAFPYHNNPTLQGYVERAASAKREAKQLLMTATPPASWQYRIQQKHNKQMAHAILPLRFHGKPLPVPRVIITNIFTDYLAIIEQFFVEVERLEGCGLIFVPTVEAVHEWTNKINSRFSEKKLKNLKYFQKIKGIHAGDREYYKQVDKFREGEIRFLVTTTILERGVTFSNLHVLVLDASHNIYDESTLVQIAGRVGRSQAYPGGLVWFASKYQTNSIKRSIKQIQRMNQRACLKNSFTI